MGEMELRIPTVNLNQIWALDSHSQIWALDSHRKSEICAFEPWIPGSQIEIEI